MKASIPYSEAKEKAEELKALLLPYCSQLEIAGSIRRQKDWIGDIELVGIASNRNQLALKLYEIAKIGVKRDARQVKFSYRGMQVDFFLPQVHDFGRQFAIRTGSADFSFKTLAVQWKRKGFVGSDEGLRNVDTWEIANVPTEEEFFKLIGLKWIDPRDRNY